MERATKGKEIEKILNINVCLDFNFLLEENQGDRECVVAFDGGGEWRQIKI